MTPLEALRAIGCTDEEIRTDAGQLTGTAEEYDRRADDDPSYAANCRLYAAVLRAAEQLGPGRTPVTRETPLGSAIAHDAWPDNWTLVGWDGDEPVARTHEGRYLALGNGWYVVEGER